MSLTITNPNNANGVSAVPGADNRSLGKKLYEAELLTEFEKRNIAKNLITTATISGGTIHTFTVMGSQDDLSVKTHTPGTLLSQDVMKVNQIDIKIGDLLYISTAEDNLDARLAHIETRQEIARQRASKLSTDLDKKIFAKIEEAVGTTPLAGQKAGKVVTNTTIASATTLKEKGNALKASILEMNAKFNTDDVDVEGRVVVVNSENFQALQEADEVKNVDFGGQVNGTVATSYDMLKIGGVTVLRSNHLPTTANLEGLMFTKEVVGMVSALELSSESEYKIEYQSTIFVDKLAYGLGVLNPGASGKIMSA